MAVKVRYKPSRKTSYQDMIGDSWTSSTSIDFAEVSEEIERERAAIYGWFPPKVELRVRTTDL